MLLMTSSCMPGKAISPVSNISNTASYTIDQCTNAHRLAWDIYSTGTGFSTIGNSNGYCYLDNIKVSIVNE